MYARSCTTNASHDPLSFRLPLDVIKSTGTIRLMALLDCEATHCFISPQTVIRHRWTAHKLDQPLPVFNADGTPNRQGSITEYILLFFSLADKVM